MDKERKDIRRMGIADLEQLMLDVKEPKFRGKQVHQWLWQKNAETFDDMTNLSKKLREYLKSNYFIKRIVLDTAQHSSDGTIKSRFMLHDGRYIEAVLIPRPKANKYTVCVSSQVGCSLACKFCATGMMSNMRNLDYSEIYDQVVHVKKQCEDKYGHNITNIVYMGMGEPLLNYKNVMQSIDYISGSDGLGMSPKRITLSNCRNC